MERGALVAVGHKYNEAEQEVRMGNHNGKTDRQNSIFDGQ